ncbi:unnamed protein product [Prunus armeniaca]
MSVQGALNGNGQVDDLREENLTPQTQPVEELETVVLSEKKPDRCVKIGTTLTPPLRVQFIEFLRHHSEVFAWSYDDMPATPPPVNL